MTRPPEEIRDAAQELLRRRRAGESLESFREYMHSTGSVDFQHPLARHHKLIVQNLEKLESGVIQRLLILAPPGSAKSTYCSIQYPLWRLAKRPAESILCASNTQDLASIFNRRRRNIALTPQWATLAQTTLAEDLQGAEHFGTKKEGGIKAAGVGSSIVGFRSHLNVLDDPIRGLSEALSSPTLEGQWDWYHNEFRTRLVPGGKELIVSTRWAKKDIAGRILETERDAWTVLRLPMLADRDDDPLGRTVGESLWPEYFGPAHIAEKQKNLMLWSTQFQQTPLDESGSWIGNENLKYTDSPPRDMKYVVAVDLALTIGRGDYTVMIVAGLDSERRIHIVDVMRDRISPDQSVDRLFTLCDLYKPSEVLIDDDNASKVFSRLLFSLGRQIGKIVPLSPQPIRGKDKETRAAAIRGLFLSDAVRIVRAPWNTALHAELLEFPSGDHDDQVDALSLIGRRFPVLSTPSGASKAPDPYAGKMIRLGDDGRMYLSKSLNDMFGEREDRIDMNRGRI